jgi:hypothetical protein
LDLGCGPQPKNPFNAEEVFGVDVRDLGDNIRAADLVVEPIPSHVNFITDETFPLYFDDVQRWARIYGFKGAFRMEMQEWRGIHLLTQMRKVALDLRESAA